MRQFISRSLLALAALALTVPALSAQTAAKRSARTYTAETTQQARDARSTFQDVQVRTGATSSSRQLSSPVMNIMAPANNRLADQIRQATGGVTITGNVIYSNKPEGSDQNAHLGMYTFNTDGTNFQELLRGNLGCYAAVPMDGVYYNYVAVQGLFGYSFYCRTYDMDTWEQLGSTTITNAQTPRALATDGTNVYGCFYNGQSGDAAGYQYGKLDLATNEHTVIRDLPQNWNACAWGNDGMIYAIDMLGDLYKVVPATGDMTKVGATGRVPKYIVGACVDKKSGRMFWTLCPEDENGYLCEINLSTGAATQLCQFADGDEIAGIFVPFIADDKAPAAVTDLAASFQNGSLTGKVSFKCPTTLFDGTVATGALTYKILANGEQVATGSTSFGATVNADVTVSKADNYTLTVIVSNDKGDGPKTKTDLFIGKDTPKPTTVTIAYANGKFNVSWTPATETVNGGYMDLSKVSYTVTRYPGATVVANNTTATSLEDPVATPSTYTSYYYTVVVNCDGISSSPAESNRVGLGEIVPPYENKFEVAEDADLYTIVDVNEDGKTWEYNKAEKAMRATYHSQNQMDDWLITPGIKLEAGKTYRFSMDARNHSAASFPERFEVKMGTAPEVSAMTKTIIPETEVNGKVWTTFEEYITPTTTGTYCIGIHGVSAKNMFYLFVTNIAVSAPMDGGAPGEATELTATADASGALKAVIAGKAPAKALNGGNLASLSKIEIQRDGELVKTLTGIQPGAAFSFEDNAVPSNGDHTWTIVCSNDKGAGKSASVSAFVGLDVPEAPTNVQMTETADGKVHLTWTAPTTDVNGKPLGSTPVTYKVVKASSTSTVYADNLTGTTFDYEVCTEGQEFFQAGVFAVTEQGVSKGVAGPFMAIGFPYQIPYTESMPDGTISSILGLQTNAGRGAKWSMQKDGGLGINSADNDNGFIAGKFSALNDAATLFTGKIDLTNAGAPMFAFYTYNIVSEKDGEIKYDINELDVVVREANTEEWTSLKHGTVNELCNGDTAAWKQVRVDLSAYKGKKIQVGVKGTCKWYVYVMLDKLQVFENLNDNLGVNGFTAPAEVKPNEEFALGLEVENRGANNATGYTVEFYRGDSQTPFKTIDGVAIAPGAIATYSTPASLGFADEDAQATFRAVVKYAKDENQADNTSETLTVVRKYSSKPAPTTLSASRQGNDVKLTWEAPAANAPRYASGNLDDLESYTAFAVENPGDWTMVDVDQKAIGGFQNLNIPNHAAGADKSSFFVFKQGGDFNQSFAAHSGTQFFGSLFNYDASQVDDWCISPQLSGSAQTISFWAKSYSASYPEVMEVLISSTDKETASFTSKLEVASVPAEWTEYTVDVPAGTKYFAVRNKGADKFMLMLDDFTFESKPDVVAGYNVYRDNVKINTELVPAGTLTYTDANVSGDHIYHVTAVYTSGEESAPTNGAKTGVNGIDASVSVTAGQGYIAIAGAEGQAVSIVGINGIRYYAAVPEGDIRIELPAGVYIVRVSDGTIRLVVK